MKISRVSGAIAAAIVGVVLGLGGVAASPAGATASTITPGALCRDDQHWQTAMRNGVPYYCGDKNGWRWLPGTSPSSAAPTTPPVTASPSTADQLPVTGSNTTIMVSGALLLIIIGASTFMVARRRRVRFTAV